MGKTKTQRRSRRNADPLHWDNARPVVAEHESGFTYAAWLRDLHSDSGVYAIYDAVDGTCLYVGESHSDRLYDTITRHFRKWKIDPRWDKTGRKWGGTTYNRHTVVVAVETMLGSWAVEKQDEAILKYKPTDNTIVPIGTDPEPEAYDDGEDFGV